MAEHDVYTRVCGNLSEQQQQQLCALCARHRHLLHRASSTASKRSVYSVTLTAPPSSDVTRRRRGAQQLEGRRHCREAPATGLLQQLKQAATYGHNSRN